MRFLAAAFLVGGLWGGAVGVLGAEAQDLERAVTESYPTNLALLTQVSEASVGQLLMGFQAPAQARILVEAADRNDANWFVEDLMLEKLTDWGYQPFLKAPSPTPQARKPLGASRSQPEASTSPPAQAQTGSLADAMAQGKKDSVGVAGTDTLVAAARDSTAADSASVAPPPPAPRSSSASEARSGAAGEERPEYVLRYRVVQFDLTYPKSYRTSPFGSRKVQRRASVSLTAHLLKGGQEEVVWGGHGEVERIDVVPQNKLSLLEGTTFPFQQPKLETKGWGSLVEPALVTAIAVGLIYLFYTNQN